MSVTVNEFNLNISVKRTSVLGLGVYYYNNYYNNGVILVIINTRPRIEVRLTDIIFKLIKKLRTGMNRLKIICVSYVENNCEFCLGGYFYQLVFGRIHKK